jgi:hypothetical protein
MAKHFVPDSCQIEVNAVTTCYVFVALCGRCICLDSDLGRKTKTARRDSRPVFFLGFSSCTALAPSSNSLTLVLFPYLLLFCAIHIVDFSQVYQDIVNLSRTAPSTPPPHHLPRTCSTCYISISELNIEILAKEVSK